MTRIASAHHADKIVVHVATALAHRIPTYLENRQKDIQSIQAALAQGDYATIMRLGHGMKGSGGSYGFHPITEIGHSLEQAAQEKNREEIRQGMDELSTYLARVEIAPSTPPDVPRNQARVHPTADVQRQNMSQPTVPRDTSPVSYDFTQFKEFLFDQLNLDAAVRRKLSSVPPAQIYASSSSLGFSEKTIAQYMAQFLQLTYTSHINPQDLLPSVLSTPFCRANHVVVIRDTVAEKAFVLSNPFNLELLDALQRFSSPEKMCNILITTPKNMHTLLQHTQEASMRDKAKEGEKTKTIQPLEEEVANLSDTDSKNATIVRLSHTILEKAVDQRASDIHIEPKESRTVVRFRVDGDMRDIFTMEKPAGVRLISRFKVLGKLDMAERRKPQDGAYEAVIQERTFKLRLATSSTPNGESLIMRLLEPSTKPPSLHELGMSDAQVKTMLDFTNHSQGLILIVGPTGAGKTTTIYSLISHIDCKSCSLVSIEDPVEYRIPHANQQQVNHKAGLTFEALLKSIVRQDPDILYLGEVRDQYSAKISIDFASTGHLTITSLHSSNATTALYRLERLGCSRSAMAEALLGVVAQKLIKKLCPLCKAVGDITPEESEMLAPFTHELPAQVAQPVGCSQCHNTGYFGREGVYEIVQFDREIAARTQAGMSIAEIREFAWERGDYLIGHHAAQKVKELLIAPRDAQAQVLADDAKVAQKTTPHLPKDTTIPHKQAEVTTATSITSDKTVRHNNAVLIVEDDEDNQNVMKLFLEEHGYETTIAEDGVDALLYLGKRTFDLIISDVDMPNLTGFELLNFNNKKSIKTPVIFATARTSADDERAGLELGAVDYIKKPIQKDILLLRVQRALKNT